MNIHADKNQEDKSQSIANRVAQKQSAVESTFLPKNIGIEDQRPEAVLQTKLQETANNSPQSLQLQAFQEKVNNSPQAKQAAQLQALADNYSAQNQHPIQRKENMGPLQGGGPVVQLDRIADKAMGMWPVDIDKVTGKDKNEDRRKEEEDWRREKNASN